MFRPYTVPADHKDFQVGDQAHITLWTDTRPYTVIERKGKRIKLQKARATLAPTYKLERIPGGFAGHCTNNRELQYDITRNEKGGLMKFGLRQDGRWCQCGQHDRNPTTLGKGWRAFYDYNF